MPQGHYFIANIGGEVFVLDGGPPFLLEDQVALMTFQKGGDENFLADGMEQLGQLGSG